MWNHSLTLRLFLLPSRLLCSLVRGGTCPLGPYRLIAYAQPYQRMLPQEPHIKQNLQQKYPQTLLQNHAKHEKKHLKT